MAVFPIEQLSRMRPDWAEVHGAEFLMLGAGEARSVERFDSTHYLIVLEGRTRLTVGGETVDAEAGEMTYLRAGDPVTVGPALENAVLLRLWQRAMPPFRREPIAAGAVEPILLGPEAPPRAPGRRGILIRMEVDATFSPREMLSTPGHDVLLQTNPGALSQAQAREYRNTCRTNRIATLSLRMDVTDKELVTTFQDSTLVQIIELLRPVAVGTDADLTTIEGRRRANLLLEHWLPYLRTDGARPCVHFALRPWSDAELVDIFAFLARTPPAQLGIVLHYAPEAGTNFRERTAIAAMMPWLHAVVFAPTAGVEQVMHYLEAAGFQGWLVQTLE